MENFNFKVGDKIQHRKEIVEILALFGHEKQDHIFTGINQDGVVSSIYSKSVGWEQPKQKLQKFYCTDGNIIFNVAYAINRKELKLWTYVYTEAEFLEKFDVEL